MYLICTLETTLERHMTPKWKSCRNSVFIHSIV